jgi:hypothetical protein
VMEFEVNVNGVKFMIDADDAAAAADAVDAILADVAFDWGQVSVA